MTEQEFQDEKLEKLSAKGLEIAAKEVNLNDVVFEMDARIDSLVEKKMTKSRSLNWWAIAAGLLLFAVGGYFILQQDAEHNLYAKHFEIYPNNISAQVRGDAEIDKTLTAAASAYDNENYAEVVQLLTTISDDRVSVDNSRIYLAIALMKLDRTQEAIDLLNVNLPSVSSDQKSAYLFYIGLSHLKLNRLKEAKIFLKQIESSDEFYSSRANDILKKL